MLIEKERILVLGCAGSGKTYLSRQLNGILDLPLIHLDAHFWNPGWTETPTADWKKKVEELLQAPRWIMDGNYHGTLDMRLSVCDAVIFLDFPRHRCLWGVFRRWLSYIGRTRPEMAPGCPDRITLGFLHWIWSFPKNARLRTFDLLGEVKDKEIVVLRNRREVEGFVISVQESRKLRRASQSF